MSFSNASIDKVMLQRKGGQVLYDTIRKKKPGEKDSIMLRDLLFEIVSDPRYNYDKFVKGVPLSAALKKEVLKERLVSNINQIYGWKLSEDGNWTTKQANDVMFDIVTKPEYNLDSFLKAIRAGKHP
jgi:hypothetical protein